MSVRVDLQGISADYFIDWESALGVMTGRCALLEYQTAGFSSRMRRGVVRIVPVDAESRIFYGFCVKKSLFRVFGSGKFPNTFKEKRDSQMQTQEKIIAVQARELKVLYLLPISNIPDTI
jgi:hypothetical protein